MKEGAGLLIRLVDADESDWQVIRSDEIGKFPDAAEALLVCGVTNRRIEDWLALDEKLMREVLGLPSSFALPQDPLQRVDVIKGAIKRACRPGEGTHDVVERLVRALGSSNAKAWVGDGAFETFLTDCLDAARRDDCQVSDPRNP